MKKQLQLNYLLRITIDFAILAMAFLCTRHYMSNLGDRFFDNFNGLLLTLSCVIWWYAGRITHLFEDYRSRTFSFEFVGILKTVLIHSCVLTFLFFYFFRAYPFPRVFTLVYTALIFVLITIEKFVFKQSLIRVRSMGYNSKRILIVGADEVGMEFYKTLLENEHFGYRCAGFIDEVHRPHLNGAYLGRISELTSIFERTEIDDVFVALPHSHEREIREVIGISEKNAKRVRIIPRYQGFNVHQVQMSLFGNLPILTLRPSPLDDPERQRLKRMFDLCFSIFVTVTILSWLGPLIALAIKLTSEGPVFFLQERWGESNRKITCYKFRTMVTGCPSVDNQGRYQQACSGDPRVTRLGAFLRKTSLDELPQFINVLLGNMSIVGPRPHPTPLNLESWNTVQDYMLRHTVKPGITGWAQVNQCRGETGSSSKMQNRVNLDLWYIAHWSFWLDMQIIFQTVMDMVKGDKHAY